MHNEGFPERGMGSPIWATVASAHASSSLRSTVIENRQGNVQRLDGAHSSEFVSVEGDAIASVGAQAVAAGS